MTGGVHLVQPVLLCNQYDLPAGVVHRCHGPTLSGSLAVDNPLATDTGVLARWKSPSSDRIRTCPDQGLASSHLPSVPSRLCPSAPIHSFRMGIPKD